MLSESYIPSQNIQMFSQGFLKGIPASVGISINSSIIIEQDYSFHYDVKIPSEEIPFEIDKLKSAVDHLNNDYNEVIKNSQKLSPVVNQIIESYQMILNDELVLNGIIEKIKKGFNAESAVSKEYDSQKYLFLSAKDEILKERAIDIENVKLRILSSLNQSTPDYSIAKNKIIVTQILTPSELVKYKENGVAGIITEIGGIASHVSILARSFELPAVIGVKDATKIIPDDRELIIDGFTGLIIYNPDFPIVKRYKTKINEIEEHKHKLGKLVKVESKTSDNRKIQLLANVDRIDDVKSALIVGSDGVGLARTETMLSGLAKIPGEDIQYGWYREIADRMYPKTVTFRCFDLGSDKFSSGIPLKENNPALGLRGIRYLLYNKEVFRQQIRAILRSSSNKNVRIMLPMISSISELINAKNLIEEFKSELIDSGISIDTKIPVGIMVETPAAVMLCDELAKECCFFSIGSNDLTQYVLAADRTNELVTDIYDSFNPAVLKMISIVTKCALENKISVSICGELASHSAATELLIGMGITELSVPPPLLLELKNRILDINYSDSIELANKSLKLRTSEEILTQIENG